MKRLFIVPIILILGVLSYLAYQGSVTQGLISPLSSLLAPDLTKPLSQKLFSQPGFDYTSSITLSTLNPDISYLVYNPKTFKVYASNKSKDKISPGSFTKLLTTQVVLDLFDLSASFSATKTSIAKEPTILELKEGETLSAKDLIRASIATSANDAAATLAEGVATQYKQPLSFFIDLMNQKAGLLNMNNSRFANPEGYDDDNQHSTLEDISHLVSNAQQNYPYILESGKSDMQDIASSSAHGHYYLPNWNGLLGVYPTVDGLKIAYTEKGGYSTIVTANRNSIPVVVILHGADSIRERDLAASNLLDAAYIQEKLKPINLSRYPLDKHYKRWSDLATMIRSKLKQLDQDKTSP